MIRTVHEDIPAVAGRILAHEHLRLDLSAQKNPDVVLGDAEEADIVADLRMAARLGLSLVADLSVPGSGRDLAAIARISEASGVQAVAATGYYWDPFPEIVASATPAELCASMIRELEEGVAQENRPPLRCGVIKVGTPRGAPCAVAERLFRAAAAASLVTGAAVIAHTSSLDQVTWQIAVLTGCGLDPGRILISHFCRASLEQIAGAASSGVFIGIDQIGFAKGPSHPSLARLVAAACAAGFERQLILSSDMARRSRLHRLGGTSYGTVLTHFVPHLREAGLTERQIDGLLHDNPTRLLSFSHRPPARPRQD